jgi:hypothetical protein
MAALRASANIRWTVGEHACHATCDALRGAVIVPTRPAELLARARAALDPRLLWDQPRVVNDKVAGVLAHWEAQRFMDPPEIWLDARRGIRIRSGRHRTLVAHHLGEQTIPVAVPGDAIAAYRALMKGAL